MAGRIQIDFRLRPLSDVWEAGQFRSVFLPGSKTIVTFYGPDVDTSRSGTFEGQQGTRGTLDTSVSYVIDPTQIGDLPLQGRDVYTMLVSLPGVTADKGTARGIGVSVAGARPSSSNYLLDGVENNNYLVTGPLSPVAPEAVQEYRISTNNYSAEYGQTAGFVANAVTKAGGNSFHGIGYEYLKNTVLNAADFAGQSCRIRTAPGQGTAVRISGGRPDPAQPAVLLERARATDQPQQREPADLSNCRRRTFSTTFQPAYLHDLASQLLTEFPAPVINTPEIVTGSYSVAQPVVVDRLIALERGDYTTKAGRDHLMARLAIQRLSEPDFIWSPYPAFISGLHENTTGISGQLDAYLESAAHQRVEAELQRRRSVVEPALIRRFRRWSPGDPAERSLDNAAGQPAVLCVQESQSHSAGHLQHGLDAEPAHHHSRRRGAVPLQQRLSHGRPGRRVHLSELVNSFAFGEPRSFT